MAGTTYSKFFWQDWQGDLELKMCSLAAQGWWMRLLCVAGSANDRGRVTIAGRKPLPDDMRRATGCINVTDEEIASWEVELVRNKVCDQDPDGVLVSRRQRRAADRSHPQVAGGKARAKSATRTGGRFAPAGDQQAHQQKTPAGASNAGGENINGNIGIPPADQQSKPATINHQPSSISHQPPSSMAENISRVARLGEALGFDPTTARNGHRFIEDLVRFQADGFDFELDILPAIRSMRSEGRIPRDLGSLAYFRKPIEAAKTARQIVEAAGAQRAEAAGAIGRDGWRTAMERFLRDGAWISPAIGPSPIQDGCLAPAAMLEKARAKWNEQGQHPEVDFFNRDRPWRSNAVFETPAPFWGDNVVAMPRRVG